MFENVSVLIPYQPDGGPRDQAFKWVQDFYKIALPGAEFCIGTTNDELFNRSKAINLASKQANGDIFIIADGDIIFNPEIIKEGIKHLETYPWVSPFKFIHNIPKDTTERLFSSAPSWPLKEAITDYEITKQGRLGKLNIIKRKDFEYVGGFDERFEGWGGEDVAFNSVVTTLCGEKKRLNYAIYHLWHPSTNFRENPNGRFNIRLKREYQRAKGNVEEMWKLIRGK